MLNLTRHERIVIFFLILVLLTGTGLQHLYKIFPELNNIVSFLSNDRLSHRSDLNKITYEELVNIPFVGPASAQRIVDYRKENNGFKELEELMRIKGIGKAYYKKISKNFKINPKKENK